TLAPLQGRVFQHNRPHCGHSPHSVSCQHADEHHSLDENFSLAATVSSRADCVILVDARRSIGIFDLDDRVKRRWLDVADRPPCLSGGVVFWSETIQA
ncbi:hypothetical protein, partial [Sandarakinorhabdus cyanobacteriorum]|uniref:hypothetical protein n=1 Tax=Sandarakinorhabdus cyanobacteriorum TaxID=1981098 RepID=UPI001A9C96FC